MTTTENYTFSQNWFSDNEPVWFRLKNHMIYRKKFLEIGSFEGRSTVWAVENMMDSGGKIVCIDTWLGGEEHTESIMDGAEDRFKHNIKIVTDKFPDKTVAPMKGTSYKKLAELINNNENFDFIYIDGSHTGKDVIADACMAFGMLRHNGIMVFDDYLWGNQALVLKTPKHAIDTFIMLYADVIELIHIGYQLAIRKKV